MNFSVIQQSFQIEFVKLFMMVTAMDDIENHAVFSGLKLPCML